MVAKLALGLGVAREVVAGFQTAMVGASTRVVQAFVVGLKVVVERWMKTITAEGANETVIDGLAGVEAMGNEGEQKEIETNGDGDGGRRGNTPPSPMDTSTGSVDISMAGSESSGESTMGWRLCGGIRRQCASSVCTQSGGGCTRVLLMPRECA